MGLRGPKPRTIKEIIEFLRRGSTYDEKTDCYLWQGRTAGDGYGSISFEGKNTYIHRLIYKYVFDEDPLVIRHTCDRPNCWNPDHLKNGSHEDNVLDKVQKLRHCFGTKQHNSKLDDEKVRDIRTNCSLSPTDLAKKYGVSRKVIYDIREGVTWKHVQ